MVSDAARAAAEAAVRGAGKAPSPEAVAAARAAVEAAGQGQQPETGFKKTSLIPAGTSTAGEWIGRAGGAALGAPLGPVGIAGGAYLGGIAGAGVGDFVGELGRQYAEGEDIDVGGAGKSAAVSGAVTAALPLAGKAARVFGLGKIKDGSLEALKQLKQMGTGLIPAEVFDSPLVQLLTAGGEYGVGGVQFFQRNMQARKDLVKGYLDNLFSGGTAGSLDEVGRTAARGMTARRAAAFGTAEEDIKNVIGTVGTWRLGTSNIKKLIEQGTKYVDEIGGPGAVLSGAAESPLTRIKRAGETLSNAPTFANLDHFRKSMGDVIYDKTISKQEQAVLKRNLAPVYEGILEAQRGVVRGYDQAHGTKLLGTWLRANKVYEKNIPIFGGKGTVGKLLAADERAVARATTGSSEPIGAKKAIAPVFQKDTVDELVQVRDILGRNSPEFGEIRQRLRDSLWKKTIPSTPGGAFDGNAALRELSGEGESSLGRRLYEEAFDPGELVRFRRVTTALNTLVEKTHGVGTVALQLGQAGLLFGGNAFGFASLGSVGSLVLGTAALGGLMSSTKFTNSLIGLATVLGDKNSPRRQVARALTTFLAQASAAGVLNTHDGVLEIGPDMTKALMENPQAASDLGLAAGQ